MSETNKPENAPLPSPIFIALLGRCPRCGKGKLFKGFLSLQKKCSQCGLDYGFADSGDGPAVFVILIAGFIVIGLALYVEVAYQPPIWVHAVLWLPIGIGVPLLLLRPFKAILVALQYRYGAQEGRHADHDS
jgi:uncharacterized protein (DUF983 family)